MPFFVLQICGYDLFRCCGESTVEQILNGFVHRTDGVAKWQRVFTSEKQAFIDFATESGRELDVNAELSGFCQTVAQAAAGQAVQALRTAARVGFGVGLQLGFALDVAV